MNSSLSDSAYAGVTVILAVTIGVVCSTAAAQQPRLTTAAIPGMVALVHRELASIDGLRVRTRIAVRADSGRPRADSVFARLDSVAADTIAEHLAALARALDPIGLWPDTSLLKPVREAFASHGIWLEIGEGVATPTMNDSMSRARFGSFLTRPMRELLDIRSLEQRYPIGGDGEIIVPLDEIGRRLARTDRVLAMGRFAGSDQLASMRATYLSAYLEGQSNSPAFTDDGILTSEVRASLERFRDTHPSTESGRIVGRYLTLLRSAKWHRTKIVVAFVDSALQRSRPQ